MSSVPFMSFVPFVLFVLFVVVNIPYNHFGNSNCTWKRSCQSGPLSGVATL